MNRTDVIAAILHIAERQFGVFSLRQLEAVGGTKDVVLRMRRGGHWRRVAPGVYVVRGTPASWKQDLMVAVLAAGDGAVVAHRAALAVWRLHPTGERPPVEIGTPWKCRVPNVRVHTLSHLIPGDIARAGPLPVTSPTRTLIDSAWYFDPPTFERLAERAFSTGATSPPRLQWRFHELAASGRPGIASVRSFFEHRRHVNGASHSELETMFDQVARRAGMPAAERQVPARLPNGRVAIIDRYWPQFRLAVELDGADTHATRTALVADARRQNQLHLLDRVPLRFTHEDLTQATDDTMSVLRAATARTRGAARAA